MKTKASEADILRLKQLREAIEYHRYNYHVLDKQEISEEALDSLKHELVLLEEKYPELVTPDSPSQRVSGKPLPQFEKVKHIVPQWSFNDAFSPEEMQDFDDRVKRFLVQAGIKDPKPSYTCEHKIDGLKIVLTYEDGILIRAATRGDGTIGEDVTSNVKTIESVPLKLKSSVKELIVEGEAWIAKSTLENLNKERHKKGEEPFANPRNLAAGSIRQLDPKIAAERHIDSYIYDIALYDKTPNTQQGELNLLKDLGFKVNPYFKHCKNIDEVITYWQEWQKKMPKQDYWADGVVVKVDERQYQELLGYTGKAPRWGIAFKFPGEEVTTILEDITFQVGRTGVITPVANLKPVSIGGSTVSRATLHNEDEIKRLDIRVGDTVILKKAGDVIPDIVGVVKELRDKNSKPFVWPSHVAACGGDGKIERVQGQAAWKCVNTNSFDQFRRKFHYFTSKKCFNIDGLGPKILDLLIENGLISTFDDIFTLKRGDLLALPRFAEKSADNLLEAIGKSRRVTLSRLLTSLSIPQVGEETAYDLSRALKSLENIEKASKEEIESIYGIGPIVGASVYAWFKEKENKKLISNLLKYITLVKDEEVGGKLSGKSFVFTGTLPTLDRDKAESLARMHGADISSSVSKKTSYVVAGEEAGSKLEKARQLGVEVIDEKGFLSLIGNSI